MLDHNKDIFSTSDTDIGHSNRVQHKIHLDDNTPFKQRHRRIPPSMIEEVRNHIQQLLAAGIIRRSESPWTSNVVLVRKKSGELRMCVDYRQLNASPYQSEKFAASLPQTCRKLAAHYLVRQRNLETVCRSVPLVAHFRRTTDCAPQRARLCARTGIVCEKCATIYS